MGTIGSAQFAEAVDVIRATPFRERNSEPRPSGYYGTLLDDPSPAQRQAVKERLNYARDVFRFAGVNPVGSDVLEAGSGFGVGLITFAYVGARSVTGVELVDWQAEWARECINRLPDDIRSRIVVHSGTASALPVEDKSFDVVLSLEAISHYLDYEPFLAEAWRVLRPGGVLIVSDGNNARNPRIRRYNENLWAGHEVDPREYRHDPARGDYNPWLLVEHRRRIILEAAPRLDESDSYDFALNTAGMVRAEIVEAVRRYVEIGERPTRRYVRGTLTVHPDHEMVMERLLDPWALAKEIGSVGFRTRVRGHWAGASGKLWHRAADRALGALSPATMWTARGFRIAAYKPD